MLLEQVQKNNGTNSASKDIDENNDENKFSDSFSSSATNPPLMTSPTQFSAQPHHPLSIETNQMDNRASAYTKTPHLLKLFEDSTQRKGFAHPEMAHADKTYPKFSEKTSISRKFNETRELDGYVFGRRVSWKCFGFYFIVICV